MALPPRDHHISLAQAQVMTQRYQGKFPSAKTAGAFHGDQVDALLRQPGCVALRIYYGLNDQMENALILVGVNGDDQDMTDGDILEVCLPCPPFCTDGEGGL